MYGERLEDIEFLWHPANAGSRPLMRRHGVQRLAPQHDAARALTGSPGQGVDEGGFTCAVGADQSMARGLNQAQGRIGRSRPTSPGALLRHVALQDAPAWLLARNGRSC